MTHDRPTTRDRCCLKVLIDQDEWLVAMDLEMMLEDRAYEVIGPATSIAGALSLLETSDPDVAVLDVNVKGQLICPVADELLRREAPFILASAYTTLDFEGARLWKVPSTSASLSTSAASSRPSQTWWLLEVGRSACEAETPRTGFFLSTSILQ